MTGPRSRRTVFSTVQEAEHAALRWFLVGFLMLVVGIILIIALPADFIGGVALAAGIVIMLGDIGWFMLVSNSQTSDRPCPWCGTLNPVFREEKHFRCQTCGHVVILRES